MTRGTLGLPWEETAECPRESSHVSFAMELARLRPEIPGHRFARHIRHALHFSCLPGSAGSVWHKS